MFPSPTRMFLTKGVGSHRHALTAFEFALCDADIEQQNLVYMSSILPPRCGVIAREAGIESLKPGDIIYLTVLRTAADGSKQTMKLPIKLGDASKVADADDAGSAQPSTGSAVPGSKLP